MSNERYVKNGPPIPLPSREEMLSMPMPFAKRLVSRWTDPQGRPRREPITLRCASLRALEAW